MAAGAPLAAADVTGTTFGPTLAHSMNGLRVTEDFGATHGVHSGNVKSFYYCEALSTAPSKECSLMMATARTTALAM